MPQAKILVNGILGSNDDISINTVVTLSNQNIGGESTYAWAIVDQPTGTVDNLSSTSIQSPTYTPTKEGTYLIHLVVNKDLPTEQSDLVVVAVRQIKTRERIPAAGETTQASTARGWAEAMNSLLLRMDKVLSDPGVIVGVAGASGLTRGCIVRATGGTILKSGLPGQESVPSFTLATAAVAGNVDEMLCVLEGGIDGSQTPANGALIKVRFVGVISGITSSGAVGDSVFVSDTGTISTTAGTVKRQVGSIMSVSGSYRDIWFNGLGGTDASPTAVAYHVHGSPGSALVNAIRTDGTNATGLTIPVVYKAGNASTIPLVAKRYSSGGAAPFQIQDESGNGLAYFDATGNLVFVSATANKTKWPNFTLGQTSTNSLVVAPTGNSNTYTFNADTTTGLRLAYSGGAGAILAAASGTTSVGSTTSHPLNLLVGNAAKWQVDTSGHLNSQSVAQGITNIRDPQAAQDAATKHYVDVTGGGLYPNAIINGAFMWWQRNASFAVYGSGRQYTADRWAAGINAAVTGHQWDISRQDTTLQSTGCYALRMQRPAGNTNTDQRVLMQELDRGTVKSLRGKACRLSFYVRVGADFSGTLAARVASGTGTNTFEIAYNTGSYPTGHQTDLTQQLSPTTTWAKVELDVPALRGTIMAAEVRFIHTPSGTAGTNDWFELTEVQLIPAQKSQPYQFAGGSFNAEYYQCLRYYEKSYPYESFPGTAVGKYADSVEYVYLGNTDTVTIAHNDEYWRRFNFTVPKHHPTPTVTVYSVAASIDHVSMVAPASVTSSEPVDLDVEVVHESSRGFGLVSAINQNLWANAGIQFHWTADGEI